MKQHPADRLIAALQAEAGQPSPVTEGANLAQQLMTAYATSQVAPRCPPGARHRAYALIEQLPLRLREVLAALTFDSWAALAPVARSLGTQRLLSFATEDVALDVELGRDTNEGLLTVSAAVIATAPCTHVRLVSKPISGTGRTWHLGIQDDGVATARIRTSATSFVIHVDDALGTLLTTPAIEVP